MRLIRTSYTLLRIPEPWHYVAVTSSQHLVTTPIKCMTTAMLRTVASLNVLYFLIAFACTFLGRASQTFLVSWDLAEVLRSGKNGHRKKQKKDEEKESIADGGSLTRSSSIGGLCSTPGPSLLVRYGAMPRSFQNLRNEHSDFRLTYFFLPGRCRLWAQSHSTSTHDVMSDPSLIPTWYSYCSDIAFVIVFDFPQIRSAFNYLGAGNHYPTLIVAEFVFFNLRVFSLLCEVNDSSSLLSLSSISSLHTEQVTDHVVSSPTPGPSALSAPPDVCIAFVAFHIGQY